MDCRAREEVGRPVRMLFQRCRGEKTVVWPGDLGVMESRGQHAVRSHVLEVDLTGLADDRDVGGKRSVN